MIDITNTIQRLHEQWKAAKERAAEGCEERSLPNVAERYRQCRMFSGEEDARRAIELFKSVQGVEFCLNYHFPNLASMRQFKPFVRATEDGIYLDSGTITLREPSRVILIGRTSATINCSTCERHEIILMRGAKATINASRWAVVFIKAEAGCQVIRNTNENAIIM